MMKQAGAIVLLVLILLGAQLFAQETSYTGDEPGTTLYEIPPRHLVDAPTAGTLPRGCFNVDTRIFSGGGVSMATSIGLSNRFMVGMAYGANGLLSEYGADENPTIEFNVKLRIIDESYLLPAIAIGFDSHGFGPYNADRERYTYKSKGFFGVVSRSFLLQDLTVGGHAGINYSLETEDDNDEEPTFFFGFDARFRYNIGFALEYDMALNDDRSSVGYAKGRGYLNTAISWMYTENLQLEFVLRNLLQNRLEMPGEDLTIGRELRLTYIEFF